MTNQSLIEAIATEEVQSIQSSRDTKEISLESLSLLVHANRLKHLEKKVTNEFVELKKRQNQVASLHKLIKTINLAMNNGEFDCSNNPELQELLKIAKEYGVDLHDDKTKYNKEETERLIDNIRITSDDLNVLNEMQLQAISRLTTERYESYQMARALLRVHDDTKKSSARAIGGR